MVRFELLRVTLSNACEIKKVCRQHYTVFNSNVLMSTPFWYWCTYEVQGGELAINLIGKSFFYKSSSSRNVLSGNFLCNSAISQNDYI